MVNFIDQKFYGDSTFEVWKSVQAREHLLFSDSENAWITALLILTFKLAA